MTVPKNKINTTKTLNDKTRVSLKVMALNISKYTVTVSRSPTT